MSSRYVERLTRVEEVLLLKKLKIDMKELKHACSYGIPDQLRPLGWRLLLNYLPTERAVWKRFLETQRENYDALVSQFIEGNDGENESDHPLNESNSSEWKGFFDDNVTLAQIDKDVRRLCPEIQFFQQITAFPHKIGSRINLSARVTRAELEAQVLTDRLGVVNLKNNVRCKSPNDVCAAAEAVEGERQWQVLERILFIYSKLNPGVKYVQGMNELIGPLYFVFASDPDVEWAEFAEADTFYCFQQMMAEIKDNFIKTLDDSQCGIESTMRNFHDLLKSFDPLLHNHLVVKLQIQPQFYAFRWLSLMLSQEFALPDVITLWDSLFADPCRFSLLSYVGLAMIESQRDFLINATFADALRLLQNFPEGIDVGTLVCLAHDIREGRVASIKPPEEKKNIVARAGNLKDKLREFAGNLKR